jgi:murein DD-endopeptidase MepM/ murein hydrolase activator NlpD
VSPGGCIGGSIEPLPGGWSLPGPRSLIDAKPAALNNPHHDYPAWDWPIPTGTPIYAIRGGRVTAVHTWPHNWWNEGCGTNGRGDCTTCGIGVTITSDDDTHWTYCHGTNLTVAMDTTVTAGQQIMWSGNTGRSSSPHLHLEIRSSGTQRCPQMLMSSLYTSGTEIRPRILPETGCSS